MAEAKRRTEVKKFVHNTDYARSPSPKQRRLLDATLGDNGYNWDCTPNSEIVPPDGSTMLVRVGQNARLEVLWGNQVVANVTDALRDELTIALCNSKQAGAITAIVVSGSDRGCHFAIRIMQDIH